MNYRDKMSAWKSTIDITADNTRKRETVYDLTVYASCKIRNM